MTCSNHTVRLSVLIANSALSSAYRSLRHLLLSTHIQHLQGLHNNKRDCLLIKKYLSKKEHFYLKGKQDRGGRSRILGHQVHW